jgi:hypothetical protein
LNPNNSEPDGPNTQTPDSNLVSEESDTDDSEPEDPVEYLTKKWADMIAELGFEESDFTE